MKNKAKKIIFVTPYFYPHTGGLENYVYNIAKRMYQDFGWNVVVITSGSAKFNLNQQTTNGVKVYRLPTWFKISNTPINPIWYFQIKKIIAIEKPDIVNAHSPVPFISDIAALVIKDTPFVLTYHMGTMKKNRLFFDLLIGYYEKFVLPITANKAKKIICPSRFVQNTIMKKYHRKISIISPAVDTAIFKPSLRPTKEDHTVLFVGRLANMYEMKGLYELIQAINKVPSAKLKIIGEKGVLKGNNIQYLGTKNSKEVAHEIQNCNVVVLPSRTNVESFGMVLIEAMACRKPVIGTRTGGITEVIRNGVDGITTPTGNPSALAKALKRILTNQKFASSLAKNGFEKAGSMYTWQKKAIETNRVFQQLI
jgi:glycosyltransferase involved in cell wall biosynthesis